MALYTTIIILKSSYKKNAFSFCCVLSPLRVKRKLMKLVTVTFNLYKLETRNNPYLSDDSAKKLVCCNSIFNIKNLIKAISLLNGISNSLISS